MTSREIANSIEVSKFGAGFYIKHPLEVGQMVIISLPLPVELRCFDEFSDEYAVCSVVRYCNPVKINGAAAHQIGVAFVASAPPLSYIRNPLGLYELCGYDGDSPWKFKETGRITNRRRHGRYTLPLPVSIEFRDSSRAVVGHEHTVAENISVGGAVVFSSLALEVGNIVMLRSDQYNVELTAEVRNVRTGSDGMPRIHLKFIDGAFPLDGIEQV